MPRLAALVGPWLKLPGDHPAAVSSKTMQGQRIGFCTAPDGVRIAYATSGGGPGRPLVRVATWLTHLEYDARVYAHWLAELGADRTYLRYDLRGCGLSDRDVADLSLEAKVADLEAVINAAQVDQVDLLGVSGGGPVAIAYAHRHPHRVAHLVLYGSYARGRALRGVGSRQADEEAMFLSLTRAGWGGGHPAFRRVFTNLFMPDASESEVDAYEEMQQLSASADAASAIRQTSYHTDVSAAAAELTVPTLVLHVRDDAVAPFEEGRRLAGLIPRAEFVPIEGRNHILGPDDPAWSVFVAELRRFLATAATPRERVLDRLTRRERDVLERVAAGEDNERIAAGLALSVRTVERHLSNIYLKLGVTGKAARAAVAARFTRGT